MTHVGKVGMGGMEEGRREGFGRGGGVGALIPVSPALETDS